MTEVPKQFKDLSRKEKVHFIFPVMEKASSSRVQKVVPTKLGRHALTAVLLAKETIKPSKTTREYWKDHDLPQLDHVPGDASYLIASGWQDFHKIATSGNVRLRVER